MAVFIQAANGSGDIFEMDSTEELSYVQAGRPTQYALEAGTSSSDHYTQTPDTFTLRGSVNPTKLADPRDGAVTTVEDFEKGLQTLKQSGEFFALSFSDNLDVMPNCLFANLTMNRSARTGTGGMEVSMTIQQVVVANQSAVVLLPVPADRFKDQAAETQSGAGNTTAPTLRESDLADRGLQIRSGDPNARLDTGVLPPATGP